MKNKSNSHNVMSTYIQSKLNFDLEDLNTVDMNLLNSFLDKLEILRNNILDFFKFFLSQHATIKIELFDRQKADKISKETNFNDVIGKLENGWILGRNGVHFYFGNEHNFSISYKGMANVEWVKFNKLFSSVCSFKNQYGLHVGIPCDKMDSYKYFFITLHKAQIDWENEIRNTSLKLKNEIKLRIENKLTLSKNSYLNNLDKDSDGNVDLAENDFNKLLSKNQKKIIELDKNYIHQFVKISNFIKTKRANTQKIFESIRDTSSQEELEERVSLLKNQIHTYELLVFHSINMMGSLISQDLISFYEIYESFDKIGVFNSNWENEVSEKLTNIGDKLDDLMYSIYNMEQNIVNELSNLSYVTQESFEDLNRSVTSQLKEVESSINTNNLLAGIQTYQLYKINKNTKGLR
jgi:hypothetical protein